MAANDNAEHPVLFKSCRGSVLVTRMERKVLLLLQIIAMTLGNIAGQMSLSNYPCFKPKPLNYRRIGRIVGGFDAKKGEQPYIVGLMRHGGVVCGASIISEDFLVLAGHCVCNNRNQIIKPTQFRAFVGMHKLSDVKVMAMNQIEDESVAEVFIEKIIVHPNYVCGKTENDIALLKLKYSIKFNGNVQPLCLNTGDENELDLEIGSVSGWGWTNENLNLGDKPDVLQTVDVPVWENEECQSSYKSLMKNHKITENQLCAGGDGMLDACFSDSGG